MPRRSGQHQQRGAKPHLVAGDPVRQPRLRRWADRSPPNDGEVGEDIREQTSNVLERIKTILAAAGTSLDDADCHHLLDQRGTWLPTTRSMREVLPDRRPPDHRDRAILNAPELLMKISVTACCSEVAAPGAGRRSPQRFQYRNPALAIVRIPAIVNSPIAPW